MQPYVYYIKRFLDVVDGDTFKAEVDVGFCISRYVTIRLMGLDAPEIHSTDPKERLYGQQAKQWLTNALSAATKFLVQTVVDADDKYGRFLGIVVAEGNSVSINDSMVNQGFAWKYDGGKKIKDFDALDAQRARSA